MLKLNLPDLLEHVKQKKLEAQMQNKEQIRVTFKVEGFEFPLFISVYEPTNVIQFLLFMPCGIAPDATNDIARLLLLLNKEIDLPGFGMYEDKGAIYYRCVLPTAKGEIEEGLFNKILLVIPQLGIICFPMIAKVASKHTSFEDMRGQVVENLKKVATGKQ